MFWFIRFRIINKKVSHFVIWQIQKSLVMNTEKDVLDTIIREIELRYRTSE